MKEFSQLSTNPQLFYVISETVRVETTVRLGEKASNILSQLVLFMIEKRLKSYSHFSAQREYEG